MCRKSDFQKQQCCRYDVGAAQSSLQGALAEFFHPDLAAWLLTEMAQNRDRALGAKKVPLFYFPPLVMNSHKGARAAGSGLS